MYDFHIKKKKVNNTAGWIVLGAGAAMVIGGYGWNMSGGYLDNDTTNNNRGIWLLYLGGAVSLVSIPLFIGAGSHKKKAKIYLSQGAVGYNNEFKFSGLKVTYSF
ncbi:hypothetical protein J4050_02550 [Winogradskyella sp. DF17]|uniref:Uncharacterized protein n=1 Tax=Winogradskyella pelagia TaxID=2819984 RepID=A0ABS3SYN9_9FLAO|nr:hypothetical protein [Winogradskyella sp. DF17]MBO3115607.1 hypothetical protein [Winogradskyella sp. DF17]